MEPDLLICQCHSTDHQLIFLYDEDKIEKKDGTVEIDKTVYIHVYLSDETFWRRLWYGIKYIFGYKCRYGAFDEFIIKPEDAPKFEKVAEFLKK